MYGERPGLSYYKWKKKKILILRLIFAVSAQGESHERQIEIRAKTPERKLLILISLSLLSGSLL